MSKRTSTTRRNLTVVSAPGREGNIEFVELADGFYKDAVYRRDEAELYANLRLMLPIPTWKLLCKRMAREVTE